MFAGKMRKVHAEDGGMYADYRYHPHQHHPHHTPPFGPHRRAAYGGRDFDDLARVPEDHEMWPPVRKSNRFHLPGEIEEYFDEEEEQRAEEEAIYSQMGKITPETPASLSHRRQHIAARGEPIARSWRRPGGRRLPATPTQPSTLNIDSLANISAINSSPQIPIGGGGNRMGSDIGDQAPPRTAPANSSNALTTPMNFPKLNISPSRGQTSRVGVRLPDLPVTNHRGLPNRQGGWSRSLDDPVAFEEAVIAGRGSRQLPRVGPQQLASARGRGIRTGRRELPRPGTTIGFAPVSNRGYPLKRATSLSESDEEDWC